MRNWLLVGVGLLTAVLAIGAMSCGAEEEEDVESPTPVATEPRPTTTPVATAAQTPTVEAPTPSPSPTPAEDTGATGPCSDPALSQQAVAALPGLAQAPGRIAFVCEGQIWTMRPDGTDHRRVTQPTTIDYSSVSLNRVPEDQPPTAAEIERLERRMNESPKWLPGGRIVFESLRDTLKLSASAEPGMRRPFVGASELYVVNPDGTGLTRLTDYNFAPGSYPGEDSSFRPAECANPDFCFAGLTTVTPRAVSPDGAMLAVRVGEIRFSECCVFDALLDLEEAGILRLSITPGEPQGGKITGFSWAPDGARAALSLYRGVPLGEVLGEEPRFKELAVRDLASEADTVLVRAGEGESLVWIGSPAWSPVGDRIAFCGGLGLTDPAMVYTVPAAGGEPRVLVAPGETGDCGPVWSPDGKYIALDSGDEAVLVVDTESGASAKVSLGGQPSWGSGG